MKLRALVLLILLSPSRHILSGIDPDRPLDIVHYSFAIVLNDTTDSIEGDAVLTARLSNGSGYFDLDLKNADSAGRGMKVSSVTFGGKECRWDHSGNRIRIFSPASADPDSTVRIRIVYSGIPADGLIISKNKYGDRTFFSDHWPDRASNYLPVVDHPSDKAAVKFSITAPSHYRVVAGGILREESRLEGGVTLTCWEEEVPVPVKVMAFGAAPFASELAGTIENIPVWSWVYRQNRKEGFSDYSIAVRPLRFFISLIGPYSYKKLANVQSRTIFGGLENAGCIFYSEKSVTGRGAAESLIAHEIAHQWFGNSVTETDWHHIWLSEGFATYLTSVYMEKNYGPERLRESMRSARERVLGEYGRNPSPLIDSSITEPIKLLNANSYQKGAWVLHMLRNKAGEEKFWEGIRSYYATFRNSNASSDDFINVMEKASGLELDSFFHQWLYVPGQPELSVRTVPGPVKGTMKIILEQKQDTPFTFSIDLLLEDSSGRRIKTVRTEKKVTAEIVEAGGDLKVIPDPDVKLLFRLIDL